MYSSEIADLEQFIDSYVGPESRVSTELVALFILVNFW